MSFYTGNWGDAFKELLLRKHSIGERDVCMGLQVGEANSFIYICQLFEGVFLWANEIHTRYLEYPDYDLNRLNYAVINLCIAGRCEVGLMDDTCIYMMPGLLSVNCNEPKGGYSYPGGLYEGIEIAFDLDVLQRQTPPEFSSFGLDLDFLNRVLEKGKGSYMAVVTEEAVQQGRLLYESLRKGDLLLAGYRFLTVSLLYHLKNGYAGEIKDRTLATRGQRRIANEVEQILTEDYRRHFTVEELADRFGISPSALKKYFDMPISHYLRNMRMETAKELLVKSGKSVGGIASLCGYENQSKFGSAFKAYTGVTPLEYRRLYKNKGSVTVCK